MLQLYLSFRLTILFPDDILPIHSLLQPEQEQFAQRLYYDQTGKRIRVLWRKIVKGVGHNI